MAKEYYFPHGELARGRPRKLTLKVLNSRFDGTEYGVYLLAKRARGGGVIITYVGRGNLKSRLQAHWRSTDDELWFFFAELEDDFEGFSEECRLFHEYGKIHHLDNRIHPRVPTGAPDDFPLCSELGCNGEPD